MLVLIFFITLGVFVATQEPPYLQENQNDNEFNGVGHTAPKIVSAHDKGNAPYIDRDENVVRFPVIRDHKTKKKFKKSPKRTIQKIIRKNRNKAEKRKVFYGMPRTNKPTTKFVDYDKFYGSDDQNYERTTTHTHNQRKRARKNKVSRYRMPFQSLQSKSGHRHKRDLSRELYILKDFDEIEFLKEDKDYDVAKVHIKTPW